MTAPVLAKHDGWWWPAADTDARGVLTADVKTAVPALLKHVKGRELIVQAGANVGLFPVALAKHFGRVLTVEPDEANYECLKANLAGRPEGQKIIHSRAAFGESSGMCEPTPVKATNCGAHRVEYGSGSVGVITIDFMVMAFGRACDAIWLDCEGSELFALRGAVETIRKFSPVLAVEDKGLDHRFFNTQPGALQDFLGSLGYTQVEKIGRDKVFIRSHT